MKKVIKMVLPSGGDTENGDDNTRVARGDLVS